MQVIHAINIAFTSSMLTIKTKGSTVNCLLIFNGQHCRLMTSPHRGNLCQQKSIDL
jgi:hypothetical protein